MNDTSKAKTSQAWAWYEPDTGRLRHVTFIENHTHPEGTEQIALEYQSAMDIMLGRSRLADYRVKPDGDGLPTVQYLSAMAAMQLSKLWGFNEVFFDGEFVDGSDWESPIRVESSETGIRISVISYTVNAKIYITMKNDPSYLIHTIDLKNAMAKHGLTIPVALADPEDVSIYVRKYAA